MCALPGSGVSTPRISMEVEDPKKVGLTLERRCRKTVIEPAFKHHIYGAQDM